MLIRQAVHLQAEHSQETQPEVSPAFLAKLAGVNTEVRRTAGLELQGARIVVPVQR